MDRNPVKNFFLSKLFLIISILCIAITGVADNSADGTTDFERLRKAAEQGNTMAQCNLGVCYGKGDGVKIDPVEAVKWFRKAAEQGDAAAQFNLGVYLYFGRGVAKDLVEAVKWFRKAAEQGYVSAQALLGTKIDDDTEAVSGIVRRPNKGIPTDSSYLDVHI